MDIEDEFERDARDLVLFYLFTGARVSEALYPTFDWSCDGRSAIHFPRTKSSKSRTIPKTDTVKAVLEGRRHIPGGPFHFHRDQVYRRVKMVFDRVRIKDASPHTLRKTAGAWYYMATRDIFATSRFLGHSSVTVTEQHYAGLIQSLRVEYSRQFEEVLSGRLQLGCNFEIKPDQSRLLPSQKENPLSPTRKGGVPRGGLEPPRDCSHRILSPARLPISPPRRVSGAKFSPEIDGSGRNLGRPLGASFKINSHGRFDVRVAELEAGRLKPRRPYPGLG